MDAHSFLVALTIVLGVAAITTLVCQWLRQSVVLGYVLAGFIVGPNVPIPLLADRQIIQTLSELGVILLMFSLGLRFSLQKLYRLGPKASLTALLESSLMVWLGFLSGQFFGWSTLESLFAGAIIAISSTTIIVKAFAEQKVEDPLREFVVGVLVVEDLIAILLMTTLTAVASGSGLSLAKMASTTASLAFFLVGLIALGLLVVPRAVRIMNHFGRPETTLVASIGICFGVSLLTYRFGYSVALGAFISGSLIAESGEHEDVIRLVQPVRDMFAAVFFVSVGTLIDPSLIVRHWVSIAGLSVVLVVGKVVGVSLGAFLTGNGVRTSVRAGMSLAQIGEFSFIIAGLGVTLHATREFLYPVAVAVSAMTALTTPWLIRASAPLANLVDSRMPRPLQAFVVLYGSWIERLRRGSRGATATTSLRRLVRRLVLDVASLLVVVIGASVGIEPLAVLGKVRWGLDPVIVRCGILALAAAACLPLAAGVVRLARRLGFTIAEAALPAAQQGSVDFAQAPRRMLVVTLQLAIVLLTGLPLLALTQPVFGGVYAPVLLGLLLIGLGIAFWRGATDLDGHVRAGAQAIVEALLAQARSSSAGAAPSTTKKRLGEHTRALAELHRLLPGLGDPVPVQLDERSPAVGRSLAELNLRGVTGATVLAITRGQQGLLVPTAQEVLQVGDTLALAGTHESILAAKAMLASPEESPDSAT